MPDTFTNWLTFTPASQIGYRRAYIDLPAFSYSGLSWIGASECIAQFNFSASQNFILLNRPTKPSGVNYGLCIRYRVGDTVYRYKLWQDTNFVLNDESAPLYNGQLIKKHFVLEIWSLRDLTVASQSSAIRMISSVRAVPTDITITSDYALATGAEFTNLNNTPTTYSIPSGLTSRWKADDVATGGVSSWPDAINAKELVQPTPLYQPTKVAADSTWLRGYVNFANGAATFLSATLNGADQFAKGTIYLVAELDPTPSSEVTSLSLEDAGVDYYRFTNNVFTNRFRVGGNLIQTLIDPTEARFFRNHFVGTEMGKQVDAGSLTTQTIVYAVPSPLVLYVGASINDGTAGPMKLADLLLFNNKILSEAEDLQLRQYLDNYHFGSTPLPLTFNSGGAWLDNA